MIQLWQMVKQLLGFSQAEAVTLASLNRKLDQLLVIAQKIQAAVMPLPAARIVFFAGGSEVTQVQMKDNQVLTVSIGAQDVAGNPTTLDTAAAPAWAVTDATLATITPSADGLSATVKPVGPLGSFQVQCSIPAVGAEPALSGSLDVQVTASAATQIVLQGTAQ